MNNLLQLFPQIRYMVFEKTQIIRPIAENYIEVHKLENLGDELRDAFETCKFLDENPDPIYFIKWKEMLGGR